MLLTTLAPLAPIAADSSVQTLPKADLHLHAETAAWLDRIVAARESRLPHDWPREVARLMRDIPAGLPRLDRMNGDLPVEQLDRLDSEDQLFVERVAGILELAAADGAVLVEVRFGGGTVLRPAMMALFREAERRVQARYPHLVAEAIVCLTLPPRADRTLPPLGTCLRAAQEGLAGIDILPNPYDAEADWRESYAWTSRLADAGLGITVHAGEFSTANVAAALRVPGIRRIGHAVYAAADPRLLELLAASGVAVECCPTSNVVLGAVPSYEEHPIRRFVAAGIPVTLNSDNPLRLCTRICREYAVVAALGFSPAELLSFTRNAVHASFISRERRADLLAMLDAWEDDPATNTDE